MRVVIIDDTAEGQTEYAHKFNELGPKGGDKLDLELKLAGRQDYLHHIDDAHVVVLGSGLGTNAIQLARKISSSHKGMRMIMFVSLWLYNSDSSEGLFRDAYSVGIQKILPNSAGPMELLQELLAIQSILRKEGKTREGKITVVTTVNGGAGATTITAALGEIFSNGGSSSLLWDTDYETRDLSRALRFHGDEGAVLSDWINGSQILTKETFRKALVGIGDNAWLLPPPLSMADSMDLFCHTDGITFARKLMEFARLQFDETIIDAGGTSGPAKGAMIHGADRVVIVLNRCAFGYSSVLQSIPVLEKLRGDLGRLYFIVNGDTISGQTLEEILSPNGAIPKRAFSLPPIPYDSKAVNWQGTNKTIYSAGQASTKSALLEIGHSFGLPRAEQDASTGKMASGSLINFLRKVPRAAASL
jgi:MinD-like ATPase involved in chromosome partitioning or flagellar assembly